MMQLVLTALLAFVPAVRALKYVQHLPKTSLSTADGEAFSFPLPKKSSSRSGHLNMKGNEKAIFVENLAWETDWQSLKDHFRRAGYPTVYASISMHHDTGRSKGCGIVQFETVHAKDDAIEHMTGSELDGRFINCREDAQEGRHPGHLGLQNDRRTGKMRQKTNYSPGYSRSNGGGYMRRAEDKAEVDVAAVEALIEERTTLRRSRDFEAADELRDELARDYGVTVSDRDNEWYVGGGGHSDRHNGRRQFGDDGGYGSSRGRTERGSYGGLGRYGHAREYDDGYDIMQGQSEATLRNVRNDESKPMWASKKWSRVSAESDHLTEVDEQRVQQLLAERDEAREKRDFERADYLLQQLADMDVFVDDARRQRHWWVGRRASDGTTRVTGSRAAASNKRREWFRDQGREGPI